MKKRMLKFNNIEYEIDDTILVPTITNLQSHLSTVMNGSGATINLGETAYNVDYIKLVTAINNFVSYLSTIAGSGSSVVVNGVEYSVDSAKIQDTTSWLHTAFSDLEDTNPDDNIIRLLSSDNLILIDLNGIYITVKEDE